MKCVDFFLGKTKKYNLEVCRFWRNVSISSTWKQNIFESREMCSFLEKCVDFFNLKAEYFWK